MMREDGELAYAYTLSDIRKYFTYDIARIEKSNDIQPVIKPRKHFFSRLPTE